MDFSLKAFMEQLRQQMYIEFPTFEGEYPNQFGYMQTNNKKHPNRDRHIKNVAFFDNQPIYVDENMIIFDIGNEKAEKLYPYYHILEDSPIIRKREKSDAKTRGSQATIKDKGKRDYSIISFNGKSFSKEYSKNIRGQRKNVIEKATYYINENGKRVARDEKTKSSNSYVNKHYHYLENMAIKINPTLAEMFGIQYVGSRGTSLKDEYIMQEYGAIMSFDDMLAFNIE